MGRLNAGKALEYASLYHCDPGSDYLSVISPAEGEYLKLGSNNSKDYDDSPFELTVYPSSTKGPVHVKWNESGYLTIRVVDLSGRSVETWEVQEDIQETSIELREAGIYLIQCEKEGRLVDSKRVLRL